jgi:hypothetical protein
MRSGPAEKENSPANLQPPTTDSANPGFQTGLSGVSNPGFGTGVSPDKWGTGFG